MFDTNVFNRILDGIVSVESLTGHVEAVATHIQLDELQQTKNQERRGALGAIFSAVLAEAVPTDSFLPDVSRLDQARLGGGRLVPTASAVYGISTYGDANYSAADNLQAVLRSRLDSLNGAKQNNVQDVLIAETSIKAGYVLVTDDSDLAAVAKEYGGQCASVRELWARCGAAT
jgi:predicted nucleic acid-binding protein